MTNAYVQAKLTSVADDGEDGKDKGVAQTSVTLYQVSESIKQSGGAQKKNDTRKLLVKEPRSREYATFYLNSSFLRTQEKKDVQLWNVNQSVITSDKRFFGSIIYEEFGSGELLMNFVTSEVKQEKLE